MKNTKMRDSGDGAEVEADEHLDGVSSSASGTSSHYHRNRAAAAAGSSLESQVGNWPDNWGKERKERKRDALTRLRCLDGEGGYTSKAKVACTTMAFPRWTSSRNPCLTIPRGRVLTLLLCVSASVCPGNTG